MYSNIRCMRQVSKESVQKIMQAADIDKTGLLEFDEFQSVMARSLTTGDSIAAALPMPAGANLAFEDVSNSQILPGVDSTVKNAQQQ